MIYKNEKLSKYSWFNLGGPAEVFFKPESIDELKNFLLKLKNKKDKIFILGAGSNTLFRDSGFNGAIIKLGKEFTKIKLLDDNKALYDYNIRPENFPNLEFHRCRCIE